MAGEGGLEGRVKRYALKGYKESVLIGQGFGFGLAALVSRYIGKIGEYLSPVKNTLGYVFGPVVTAVSNFFGDQIGYLTSLYAYNKEKYSGVTGKTRFAKDAINTVGRHLPAYAITYPLAIGASTLLIASGLLPLWGALVAPWAIETGLTYAAYLYSTRDYRNQQALQTSKT